MGSESEVGGIAEHFGTLMRFATGSSPAARKSQELVAVALKLLKEDPEVRRLLDETLELANDANEEVWSHLPLGTKWITSSGLVKTAKQELKKWPSPQRGTP